MIIAILCSVVLGTLASISCDTRKFTLEKRRTKALRIFSRTRSLTSVSRLSNHNNLNRASRTGVIRKITSEKRSDIICRMVLRFRNDEEDH